METIDKANTLKGLQSKRRRASEQLDKLLPEIETLSAKLDSINKQTAALQSEVSLYDKEIKSLTVTKKNKKAPAPTVSEHAVLRYCQLAMGLDLEEIGNNILSDVFCSNVNAINGNGKIPLDGPERLTAVIRNHVVVTILEPSL